MSIRKNLKKEIQQELRMSDEDVKDFKNTFDPLAFIFYAIFFLSLVIAFPILLLYGLFG